jgi:hypothetical protein
MHKTGQVGPVADLADELMTVLVWKLVWKNFDELVEQLPRHRSCCHGCWSRYGCGCCGWSWGCGWRCCYGGCSGSSCWCG